MNDYGIRVGALPTEVNEAQGKDSSSPTTLNLSPKILETEACSTTRIPYDQINVLEADAPHTHETPLQGPFQLRAGASNSETTVDPQSEVPQLPPSPSAKPGKRLSSDSLGRTNAAVVIGRVITSCATVGFLIFLWTGQGPTPDGQHASYAWRSLMFSDRLPQLITLSSVILRFSIGLQTTICTSLVAALVLERRSIALSRAGPLSILRSVNPGPRILLQQILGANASRHLLLHPEVLLLLLLAFGNVAIQFSSTILFTDLENRILVKFPQETQIPMLQQSNIVVTGWEMPHPDFSSFGELHTGYNANPDSLGLSDTGVKRHAMLPFVKSEERIALRSYRGPSIVLGSRVACMPPTVSGQLRFTNITSSGATLDENYPFITGTFFTRRLLGALGFYPKTRATQTSVCQMIYTSIVVYQLAYQALMSLLSTPSVGPLLLILSTNFQRDSWASLDYTSIELPQSEVQGEWKSFKFGLDRFVNVAVCFSSVNVMMSNVSLSTEKDLTEPSLEHGRFGSIDTSSLRRFYGAEPLVQNFTKKGIFTVNEINDPDDYVYGATNTDSIPQYQLIASDISFTINNRDPNTTLPGCGTCEGKFKAVARPYSAIFSDIITTTHRAAVALQTVNTMLVQSVHDQTMEYLTGSLPAEIVPTATVTVPDRCIGLSLVAVLTLVNLICIVVITMLYLIYSRYTLVDNFWHVISQTVSDATAQTLDHSNLSKDKDIFGRLKTGDYPVQLQNLVDTGEIKITKVNSDSDIPSVMRWYRLALQALRGKK
ncbi:hypothetical protein NPX13_g6268 [Xylaria arbuscula]|uniref:Uncharacterized protein n=1 Tax=Xylaria arbuscula TaxID=114810 RepID=A0A9W8TMA9_9PEZI|nr:hypothetical protein NPX13_g6268 [Xylaria arbuscula]